MARVRSWERLNGRFQPLPERNPCCRACSLREFRNREGQPSRHSPCAARLRTNSERGRKLDLPALDQRLLQHSGRAQNRLSARFQVLYEMTILQRRPGNSERQKDPRSARFASTLTISVHEGLRKMPLRPAGAHGGPVAGVGGDSLSVKNAQDAVSVI